MRSGKLLEVSSASGPSGGSTALVLTIADGSLCFRPRQLAKVALHVSAAIKQFKAAAALCSDTGCTAVLRRLITNQHNL